MRLNLLGRTLFVFVVQGMSLHAQPSITDQPISQTVLAGTNVSFGVAALGALPLNYQWRFDGADLPNDVIVNKAGNGRLFNDDGYAATNVSLNVPSGAVFDASGAWYIADQGNNRVLRVASDGRVITVAGTGDFGYSVNGTPAVEARLAWPAGLALGPSGEVYIADQENCLVRRIDTNGIITTVAGGGPFDGDGGPATNTWLAQPVGLALDASGDLYICEEGRNRIRRVDASGVISTIAGGGASENEGGPATSAALSAPSGIALDRDGNLFIADQGNNRVRKVNSAGSISTVAGNGVPGYSGDGDSATNACLDAPSGVAVATSGSLYISDQANACVREVDTNGVISTIAGTGTPGFAGDGALAARAALNAPTSLALDNHDNLIIVDSYNSRIRKVDSNGMITTAAGGGLPGADGPASNASLAHPVALAFDAAGNLFVADDTLDRVCRIDSQGRITSAAGNAAFCYAGDGLAATNASLCLPSGLAVDLGGCLYVADLGNNAIRKIDPQGLITTLAGNGTAGFSGDGAKATNANLQSPTAVAVYASGEIYIADQGNQRIRKVDAQGVITTVAGNGLAGYGGDGGPALSASLNQPSGVAVDQEGNLYIADRGNNRVRKVDPAGLITTLAGVGVPGYDGDGQAATAASLSQPSAVAVGPSNQVYIADSGNNAVREVTTSGTISTVAGDGLPGWGGDGGAAALALLNQPSGLAVDGQGNLFIADSSNLRVREISFAGLPTVDLLNVSPKDAGDYSVVVADSSGSVTSLTATLTVCAPPAVLVEPADLAGGTGGSATFAVAVSGTQPIGYCWYFNGSTFIQGGPNGALLLTNLALSDAGVYTVVITNAFGSTTSAAANLIVGWGPSISTQPADQEVGLGADVVLKAAVSGTGPFNFQWLSNGQPLYNSLIFTVAGDGGGTSSGDGGPATNAAVGSPSAVACDPFGNLFTIDESDASIREVDSAGLITTIAGNHRVGFSGDGSAATSASLNAPTGLALDRSGRVYIADTGNRRIRRVDSDGIITTVAGNGQAVGLGDSGVATNIPLDGPLSLALDSLDNLFIADYGNNRVFKVASDGSATIVAGDGKAGFSGDGGPATNALLQGPSAVALDSQGNLFIADYGNYRIRKVDSQGLITTFAGYGVSGTPFDGEPATNTLLRGLVGLAVDTTDCLLFADCYDNLIGRIDLNGMIRTLAGNGLAGFSGDGGPPRLAALDSPFGIALDPCGALYIADKLNNRVRKVMGDEALSLNGVTAQSAGSYSVVISSPYGTVTSAIATLTVDHPPIILSQPIAPDPAPVGSSATFSVVAQGQGSLEYSWWFNGLASIPGGTSATLSLTNLSPGDAGFYSVVVSNDYGSVTSQAAQLLVGFGPALTLSPSNQSVTFGGSAGFEVVASGTRPLTYQWYCNGANLGRSGTSSLLELDGVTLDQAGAYTVVVMNAFGSTTSSAAILTVDPNPKIIFPPGGRTAISGENVTFNVSALGVPPITYSWYFDGATLLQSGTNSSLTINRVGANDAGPYTVVVTNSYGAATSAVAELTVESSGLRFDAIVSRADGTIGLAFFGTPNSPCRIWMTTNLLAPMLEWHTISTNITGPDGSLQVIDATSSGRPLRFYRASIP